MLSMLGRWGRLAIAVAFLRLVVVLRPFFLDSINITDKYIYLK